MPRYEIECDDCRGSGIEECECCGSEQGDCKTCLGTGCDPEFVDVHRYKAACRELMDTGNGSWDVLDGRVTIGRTNGTTKVLMTDYLIDGKVPL